MKSLVVCSQIALYRDFNSMNMTNLSSKPISKTILCLKEAQALFASRERKKMGGSALSY